MTDPSCPGEEEREKERAGKTCRKKDRGERRECQRAPRGFLPQPAGPSILGELWRMTQSWALGALEFAEEVKVSPALSGFHTIALSLF